MQALFDSVVITWSLLGWLKFEIYNFAKFWKFKYWDGMNWEMRTTTSEMRNLMNDCKVSRSVQQFEIPLLFCNNVTLKFVIFMISINLCSKYKFMETPKYWGFEHFTQTFYNKSLLCHYLTLPLLGFLITWKFTQNSPKIQILEKVGLLGHYFDELAETDSACSLDDSIGKIKI